MPPRRNNPKEKEENNKIFEDNCFTDMYNEIFHTRLTKFSAIELRNLSYHKLLSSSSQIPTWETGLEKITLPSIYNVSGFVEQCAKYYNLEARTIFTSNSEQEILKIDSKVISEMLKLPTPNLYLNYEELAIRFNVL